MGSPESGAGGFENPQKHIEYLKKELENQKQTTEEQISKIKRGHEKQIMDLNSDKSALNHELETLRNTPAYCAKMQNKLLHRFNSMSEDSEQKMKQQYEKSLEDIRKELE